MTYKIIRFFADPLVQNRTIATGLTLEQAQEHCSDPETSSRTCTKHHNRRRTKRLGAWFEGYTKE